MSLSPCISHLIKFHLGSQTHIFLFVDEMLCVLLLSPIGIHICTLSLFPRQLYIVRILIHENIRALYITLYIYMKKIHYIYFFRSFFPTKNPEYDTHSFCGIYFRCPPRLVFIGLPSRLYLLGKIATKPIYSNYLLQFTSWIYIRKRGSNRKNKNMAIKCKI